MKLSVILPETDVAALDEFVRSAGLSSRSAAVQHAIRMLRLSGLEQDYQAAWDEWKSTGEQALWDTTSADGLPSATR